MDFGIIINNSGNNKDLKSWLDKIQQDSWQLELLISCFALFLLLGASSYFDKIYFDFQHVIESGGHMFLFVPLILVFSFGKNKLLQSILK